LPFDTGILQRFLGLNIDEILIAEVDYLIQKGDKIIPIEVNQVQQEKCRVCTCL
jgi:hypothetical protein